MKPKTLPEFHRGPVAAMIAAIAAASSQFAVCPAALAQQESGTLILEEVIVTARKVEESVQDVPVAIVPLTDENLKANHIVSVLELPQIVPGLGATVNSQGGAPTFAIRAAKADNGTSDTVTAYIDDVPVAFPVGISNMTYDLQSVSVLKGPQGTYFGTSTTGGAIIFRPNKPGDEFEGYLGAGAGDYDLFSVEGMVNAPLTDTAKLRIAGEWYERGEGFVDNLNPGNGNPSELNDDKHYSARATLRLEPTDRLLNDTMFEYYKADNETRQETLSTLRERNTDFNGLTVDWALAGITVPGGIDKVEIGPYPTWYEAEMKSVANTTDYDLSDNVSLKSVLSWQSVETDTSQDNDATPRGVVNGRTAYDVEQWTAEFSIDWSVYDGRLRNKTGLFFSNKTVDAGNHYRLLDLPFDFSPFGPGAPIVEDQVAAALPYASVNYYEREFDTQAIYSQFSFDISDIWTVTFGGRYTWDDGDYTGRTKQVNGAAASAEVPYGVFNGPYGCDESFLGYKNPDPETCTGHQDFSEGNASGLLTIEGRFEDHLVYLSARHGYLIGGFNNQVSARGGQVFAPEKVDDVEIGLKSDWTLGGAPIRTNIAVFYGEYKDQQRVQNGQTPEGASFVAVANAGATTFYGLDLDVTYQPTENLSLSLGWNNVTAEYDEFDAALAMIGIEGPQFIDLKGEQAAQTPKNIVTASATYDWPVTSDVGYISSTVSYSWRDDTETHDSPTVICTLEPDGECLRQNITEDFTEFDQIDSYDLVNFSTAWNSVMGSNFDLRLWIKNVTDEEYTVFSNNQLPQFGYSVYIWGEPRTWGLNLRYNF